MKALWESTKHVILEVRTLPNDVLDMDEEALNIMKDEKFWYVVRNRRIK